MACNNGKKGFHSPYGMITDLNITYTGCATTCNGEDIKPGMRLREILDILIGDCAGETGVSWGDIIGNIEDQTDLVQFIQDNTASGTWGDITGDIEEQEDLVQFVQENGFTADKVGKNLHLGGDGELNVGVDMSGSLPGAVILSTDGAFPSSGSTILLATGLGTGIQLNSSDEDMYMNTEGGAFTVSTDGGVVNIGSQGGNISINTLDGDLSVLRGNSGGLSVSGSGGTQLSSSGADTRVSAFNGNVVISPGLTASGYHARIGNLSSSDVPVNTNTSVVLGVSEVSTFPSIDGDVTFDFYQRGPEANPGRVGVRHIYKRDASDNLSAVLQLYKEGSRADYGTFIEYDSGMPEGVFISDNVLPTVGYVRDTIVADAISTLQNTIDALEARIEALENATP